MPILSTYVECFGESGRTHRLHRDLRRGTRAEEAEFEGCFSKTCPIGQTAEPGSMLSGDLLTMDSEGSERLGKIEGIAAGEEIGPHDHVGNPICAMRTETEDVGFNPLEFRLSKKNRAGSSECIGL